MHISVTAMATGSAYTASVDSNHFVSKRCSVDGVS